MLYDESVPVKVAINEAVELAKKFGGESSQSFVNGILAKLTTELFFPLIFWIKSKTKQGTKYMFSQLTSSHNICNSFQNHILNKVRKKDAKNRHPPS